MNSPSSGMQVLKYDHDYPGDSRSRGDHIGFLKPPPPSSGGRDPAKVFDGSGKTGGQYFHWPIPSTIAHSQYQDVVYKGVGIAQGLRRDPLGGPYPPLPDCDDGELSALFTSVVRAKSLLERIEAYDEAANRGLVPTVQFGQNSETRKQTECQDPEKRCLMPKFDGGLRLVPKKPLLHDPKVRPNQTSKSTVHADFNLARVPILEQEEPVEQEDRTVSSYEDLYAAQVELLKDINPPVLDTEENSQSECSDSNSTEDSTSPGNSNPNSRGNRRNEDFLVALAIQESLKGPTEEIPESKPWHTEEPPLGQDETSLKKKSRLKRAKKSVCRSSDKVRSDVDESFLPTQFLSFLKNKAGRKKGKSAQRKMKGVSCAGD